MLDKTRAYAMHRRGLPKCWALRSDACGCMFPTDVPRQEAVRALANHSPRLLWFVTTRNCSNTFRREHFVWTLQNHSFIDILTLRGSAENGRPHYSHQTCRRLLQELGGRWRRHIPSSDRFPAVPAPVYHEQTVPKTFLLSVNFSVNPSSHSLRGLRL